MLFLLLFDLFKFLFDQVLSQRSAWKGMTGHRLASDDFQTLARGIRAIGHVLRLVREFEAASGLTIHRTKTKAFCDQLASMFGQDHVEANFQIAG